MQIISAAALAASVNLFGDAPRSANAATYSFIGTTALQNSYGVHTINPSGGTSVPDGFSYDLSGSFTNNGLWSQGVYPYVYYDSSTQAHLALSPSAPGAADSVNIGGLPAGDLPLVMGPPDNSDPLNPIYGYYGPNYRASGYTGGNGFNVMGAGGTIATLAVGGPGSLTLSGLSVTGSATISSIGGVPLFSYTSNTATTFMGGFAPAALNVTGGSLSTPTLSLTAGTNLAPQNGNGPAPDPVADAGSLTINGATLSGDRTQILPNAPTNLAYGVQPVTLTNAKLNAKTELDIVGFDPTQDLLTTGITTLTASGSTITVGAVVIGTGATGYGSGSVNAAAVLNLRGATTLTGTKTGFSLPSVVVGDTGIGTLSVTAGSTVNAQQSVIGNGAGSTGNATLDGSTWKNTSFLTIGFSGNGTFTAQNNARVTSGDEMYIGLNGGSTGTMGIRGGATVITSTTGVNGTISTVVGTNANSTGNLTIDGAGSQLTSNGDMSIGYSGTGTTTITNGGALTVNGTLFRIGRNTGSTGILTVEGAGSNVTANNATVYVGYDGNGTFNVQNHAMLTVQATNIGGQADGVGSLNVDGAGTQATLGDVTVGDAGNGTLNITGNSTVQSAALTVGSQQGSTGNLVIADAGTDLAVTGELKIGDAGFGLTELIGQVTVTVDILTVGGTGNGSLTSDTGSRLTTSGDATIGDEAGSVGNVNIGLNAASQLTVGGNLTIGGGGSGSLQVNPGSTLTVNGTTITIGGEQTGNGLVTLNGGTLSFGSQLVIGDSGTGELLMQGGAKSALGGTTFAAPSVKVGNQSGSTGTLALDGNSTSLQASDLTVGVLGKGTLSLSNNAVLTSNGDVTLADQISGVVSSAGIATSGMLAINGNLTVGSNGIATMQILTGGKVTAIGDTSIGDNPNGSGIVTVDGVQPTTGMIFGTPSSLGFGKTLTVGHFGMGTLNISGGALVAPTPGGTGEVDIASQNMSTGTVAVSGTDLKSGVSSQLSANSLAVGGTMTASGGMGSLTVNAGGAVKVNSAIQVWSNGKLDASGGGSVTVGTGTAAATSTVRINSNGSLIGQGTLLTNSVTNAGSFMQTGTLTETANFTNSGAATIGGTQTWSPGTTFTNTAGTATFQSDAGVTAENLSLHVTGGTVTLASTEHLAGLNVNVGSVAQVTGNGSGNPSVILTPIITVAGTLDLTRNGLDVQAGGTAMLANITGLIRQGYKTGTWTGTGITSSAAATHPTHLTALGILLNNDGTGHTIYGSGAPLGAFDGINPALNDVLVKYTFYGDANLDGHVDGSDYTKIDSGFNAHLTGWANGDFNYDGVINGSDYTLIDNAFNSQSGIPGPTGLTLLTSSTAEIAGVSTAVPEPATVYILAMIGFVTLHRRRMRHCDRQIARAMG